MSPFRAALGADFDLLPPALKAFHDGTGRFEGRASVERGTSTLARIGLRLGGFPPGMEDRPFALRLLRDGSGERWERDFDGTATVSTLRHDPRRGGIAETFGATRCLLVPRWTGEVLAIDVTRLWLAGASLPAVLAPRSTAREWQDEQGRFRFDIAARLPGGALLIRYHGWLDVQ